MAEVKEIQSSSKKRETAIVPLKSGVVFHPGSKQASPESEDRSGSSSSE